MKHFTISPTAVDSLHYGATINANLSLSKRGGRGVERVRCISCKSKNIIKRGRQKTKFGFAQLFYCNDCGRKFADRKLINKTYGPKVITNSLNYYNLGNTLDKSAKLVNRRFKVKVSKSAVHSWIKEFKDICGYYKIREEILKNYGMEVLAGKSFEHSGLAYNFRYHKGKLDLCGFSSLIFYIKKFEQGCPEFFNSIENRCSQIKVDITIKKHNGFNNGNSICRLAELALKSCNNNKERHSVVENFMLINDSSTVACEVPVWFWEKNFDVGISGHVDLLQVRDGLVYIMDFKPNASRENEQKVASQLYFYASGFSFRTGIPLEKFRCVWFDDSDYFEFAPKEAIVKFMNSKWRSKPKILDEKTHDSVFRASPEFRKESDGDWKGLERRQISNIGKISEDFRGLGYE